ncbi:MAG: OmpH family outer membrane protein [Candidatus Latescibacterota bacterium]|jgi:outer membrane protein|nr:OmpH family outer membrane protein [Candidatus Latescibacterota bacterium]MEE2726195.1 OmpH family outer membrane protein [Candidatus Latescibacterota bacterium]
MKRIALMALALVCTLAPVAGWAEIKIGYIDSEVLKERLPEFREAQRKLDQLRQDYENQAKDREAKLMKLQEDFRKQELLMSEARKAELQADFEEKVRQLQAFTQEKFGPEGELMRKNIELSEPIFKKINDALKTLAEEEGYDFVFDAAAPSSGLVFAGEDYDLTETLLESLDEQRTEQGQ